MIRDGSADVNLLTPLQALTRLYELAERARQAGEP